MTSRVHNGLILILERGVVEAWRIKRKNKISAVKRYLEQ